MLSFSQPFSPRHCDLLRARCVVWMTPWGWSGEDKVEALSWLTKAAEQGHVEALNAVEQLGKRAPK